MPYIPKEERLRYNNVIKEVVYLLVDKLPGDNGKYYNEGDLNYIISSIVWKLFDKRPSYSNGNTLIGVLEAAKLEFYRRVLAKYEDGKKVANGDIK